MCAESMSSGGRGTVCVPGGNLHSSLYSSHRRHGTAKQSAGQDCLTLARWEERRAPKGGPSHLWEESRESARWWRDRRWLEGAVGTYFCLTLLHPAQAALLRVFFSFSFSASFAPLPFEVRRGFPGVAVAVVVTGAE